MGTIQPHLDHPHVPTEVIHDIIDKLHTGDSDCSPTWSNLALVSRCCRHRINFHRFSELEIYIHATSFERLEALASLLGSSVWQQQEGMAQHIKTVSLVLGRGSSGTPPYVQSRDSIIAEILMNLFKGIGNASSDHTLYSLTIGTGSSFWHYASNGPYDTEGLAFDTLGGETIAALHDLSQRYLTTLRLERMWNIPSSLLSASSISNLYINHAHFVTSDTSDYHLPLRNLVYLEVTEAPSFVPACYGVQKEHTGAISKAKYWIREEAEYPGLFIIGKYATTLEIVVHKILDVPLAVADYIQSDQLQCLCIQMDYDHFIVYDDATGKTYPEKPHKLYFLNILHLLPSVPPPVLDIEIKVCLRYFYHPATACHYGLNFFYSQVYHPSLVQWLERQCSLTGTQATITFDVNFDFRLDDDYDPDMFQGECEPYLRNLLSPLNGLDGVKLNIRISGAGFWERAVQ